MTEASCEKGCISTVHHVRIGLPFCVSKNHKIIGVISPKSVERLSVTMVYELNAHELDSYNTRERA